MASRTTYAHGAKGGRESRQRPSPQGITRRWPELRVVRFPDTDSGHNIDDWHMFLDDVGGPRNYGKGKARALGSMAIVYIPAREFGLMLDAKYRGKKDYGTPERAARLVAKMRYGIGDFMRGANQEAYRNRTDSILERVSSVVVGNSLCIETIHDDPLGYRDDLADYEAEVADVVGAGQIAPIWFSPAELAVKGLGQFGEGYGLDLSLNPMLYEERRGVLEYLRVYEGLDTAKFTNPDWTPHATVFELEEHIRSTTLSYGEALPDTISYDHPVAI